MNSRTRPPAWQRPRGIQPIVRLRLGRCVRDYSSTLSLQERYTLRPDGHRDSESFGASCIRASTSLAEIKTKEKVSSVEGVYEDLKNKISKIADNPSHPPLIRGGVGIPVSP
mgnify:CR=1 FL=1